MIGPDGGRCYWQVAATILTDVTCRRWADDADEELDANAPELLLGLELLALAGAGFWYFS